jgi:hypothetical protein
MSKKTASVGIAFITDKEDNKYEGSYKDMSADYRAADRMGIKRDAYEDSARDRIADKAGQKKMDDSAATKKAVNHDTGYKPGTPAFKNTPKMAHGYKGTSKSGCYRVSGHSGAHQIGKKK